MSFYRSYQKADTATSEYSYTACFSDGSNAVKTTALEINNTSFNYPVVIGNNVAYCASMLENCTSYNSPITIGENVVNCANMLRNCSSFNQDVHIANSVTTCYCMLADCPSFGANIYYHNSSMSMTKCNRILYNKNTSKRVNIYYSGAYPSATYLNTLVGSNLTWTTGDGYKYNTAQNIYIYNNYPM